jgi:hypothetical protein
MVRIHIHSLQLRLNNYRRDRFKSTRGQDTGACLPFPVGPGNILRSVILQDLWDHCVRQRQATSLVGVAGRGEVNRGLLAHVVGVSPRQELRARRAAELEDVVVAEPYAAQRE